MSQEDRKDDLQNSTALSSSDSSFAGFVDTYEGDEDDGPINQRMIQGTRLTFSNDSRWMTAENIELDPQLKLIVVELVRVVNKWPLQAGPPLDSIVIGPGQPWPNLKTWNENCPQSEWRPNPYKPGELRGPWEAQRLLYLLDPVTLDTYTYTTTTLGGTRALHELARKITWMQRYRQAGVRPVVQLAKIWMPTRFGGRLRPHLQIVDWVAPGGGTVEIEPARARPLLTTGEKLDAFAGTTTAPPTQPAPAPTKLPDETLAKAGLKSVSEPSLKEEMNDDIPF
jgi:hypothetical protein